MENTKVQEANFGQRLIGEVELPKIDVTKHIGSKAKIAGYKEMVGEYGPFVNVETETIEEIARTGQDPIHIKATKRFGLFQKDDGNIGWGSEGELAKFLKKVKKASYRDLAGVMVVVQSRTDKDQREWLTFN